MKKRDLKFAAVAMGAAMLLPPSGLVQASSHREAPFITKNPKVDASDFYMFNSYEAGRSGWVTIIANYQPLQDPSGGPNFFYMDPEALYEIHIDNNGDGKEDLTYQFRFTNALAASGAGVGLDVGASGATKHVAIPVVNFNPISAAAPSAALNLSESYNVTQVRGDARLSTDIKPVVQTGTTTAVFTKPLDYVGNATFTSKAGYDAYAKPYMYNVDIDGCTPPAGGLKPRVFVGQRQEGFAVNLATLFDIVGAPGSFDTIKGGTDRAGRGNTDTTIDSTTGLATLAQGGNNIAGKNVTSIALEIPASCLENSSAANPTIIGGWTTSSVRQARVINPAATFVRPSREGGAWAQVSRLGNPLINEVIIGLKDKDLFNGSAPSGDTQFVDYVTNPVLPDYLDLLFSAPAGGHIAPKGTSFPRADLEAVFLTGVKDTDTATVGTTAGQMVNVNQNGATAEYLRLNTAFAATARGSQNSLGAAACFVGGHLKTDNGIASLDPDAKCDPAGFPNGRRPGDDVVDIALRVAMGYLLPAGSDNPAGTVPFTDYAINYDTQFGTQWPYLNTPNSGDN